MLGFLKHFGKSGFEKRLIWLERIFKNGWHNLMRNKLLTIATTLIIALMFFVFNLMINVLHSPGHVPASYENK